MKQLTPLAALTAFGIMVGGAAFAADPGSEHMPPPPGPGKMMERLDTNKDGKVTRAEFQARGDEMFGKLDGDKSGDITRAEFEAGHKRHMEKRAENKDGKSD